MADVRPTNYGEGYKMSKVKPGDVLSCEVCGLSLVVDEECGCGIAEIICCEELMENKGPKPPKKLAATTHKKAVAKKAKPSVKKKAVKKATPKKPVKKPAAKKPAAKKKPIKKAAAKKPAISKKAAKKPVAKKKKAGK